MAKEPFIDKVIRFLEKLAWHFGIPPSEDSSLVNGNKGNTKNQKPKTQKKNNSNNDSRVRKNQDNNDNKNNNEKAKRSDNPSKPSKKVVDNSNIEDKDIEDREEQLEKPNFQPTDIDELLNNDISLREIATVKELQSLDTNHMNLPGFVSKDLKPFNKDLFTLENFEILLINMMVEKKEEYILKYTGNPLSEEEINGILSLIQEAFSKVSSMYVEYFSATDCVSLSVRDNYDKTMGNIKSTEIFIKIKPLYKGGIEDTYKMLKLCRYVKSELVNKNKINKNMSQYDIAKVLYNWVVLHTNYDKGEDDRKYSGYAAIIKGKAVCRGYTAMYNALCRCCDIDVIGMSGICADRITGGYEHHIWTLANISGKKIFIDSTWGSPIIKNTNEFKANGVKVENFCDFKWFNTSYAEFVDKHSWDKKIYPI